MSTMYAILSHIVRQMKLQGCMEAVLFFILPGIRLQENTKWYCPGEGGKLIYMHCYSRWFMVVESIVAEL